MGSADGANSRANSPRESCALAGTVARSTRESGRYCAKSGAARDGLAANLRASRGERLGEWALPEGLEGSVLPAPGGQLCGRPTRRLSPPGAVAVVSSHNGRSFGTSWRYGTSPGRCALCRASWRPIAGGRSGRARDMGHRSGCEGRAAPRGVPLRAVVRDELEIWDIARAVRAARPRAHRVRPSRQRRELRGGRGQGPSAPHRTLRKMK